MDVQGEMEKNVVALIGNGESIRLWLDVWHPSGVLVKHYGERIRYDSGMNRLSKVKSILYNGEWRHGPLTSHSLMEAWAALQSIERLSPNEGDTIVWKVNSSGSFTTRSSWNLVRDVGNVMDWSKVVWVPNHIPKHSFFVWKTMIKRVLTQSRLCKMGILQTSQCYLCWNGTKTLDHLYFDCAFTKDVWETMLKEIHPTRRRARNYVNECEWILKTYKGNDVAFQIASFAFNGSLYHIWRERNQRHFNNVSLKKTIVQDIIFDEKVNLKLLKTWKGNTID